MSATINRTWTPSLGAWLGGSGVDAVWADDFTERERKLP